MATVFESLPGVEVPVAAIASELAKLWEGEPGTGADAPSEFRASQMNFVLHFGLLADVEDAKRQFDTVVAFARRYPSRTLILCPQPHEQTGEDMRAKIFSECYIGSSRQEMSCCEMVFLSYPFSSRPFLESQVSICIEGDLPLYYWPHGIANPHGLSDYSWLQRTAKRIILDSAEDAPELVSMFQSSQPGRVSDLAYARLLPVRQSLGQFLSGVAPKTLVDGLRSLTLEHQPHRAAEAVCLAEWVKDGLVRCGLPAGNGVGFKLVPVSDEAAPTFRLRFGYATPGRYFNWEVDCGHAEAMFDADFGTGKMSLPTSTCLLNPAAALGEALFF